MQVVKNEKRLKTICLVSSLLFLIGCKKINDAPITHLYVIDVQHDICSLRRITDKSILSSIWVQDMPLRNCDGVVGLNMLEYLNLKTYMKEKANAQ